jgi:hypothetical protein
MVKDRILKHARIRLPLPPKAGVGRPGIDDRFVVNGIYALVIRYYWMNPPANAGFLLRYRWGLSQLVL